VSVIADRAMVRHIAGLARTLAAIFAEGARRAGEPRAGDDGEAGDDAQAGEAAEDGDDAAPGQLGAGVPAGSAP
jgi:hypothetical protein